MRLTILPLLSLLLFSTAPSLIAQKEDPSAISDYLQECCGEQIPEGGRYLDLLYDEVARKPYHSPSPWMTGLFARSGRMVVGSDLIVLYDTLTLSGRETHSIQQYSGDLLLRRNYKGRELTAVTPSDIEVEPLLQARYSPIPLLQKVRRVTPRADLITRPGYALYRTMVDAEEVTLEISRSDMLLKRVVRRWYDEMLGDRYETIIYDHFDTVGGVTYPTSIVTDRGHGMRDTIDISAGSLGDDIVLPLDKPDGYEVRPSRPLDSTISVEEISENIHAVRFAQAESQSLIVEFDEFLVVIDVPFSSSNGEALLNEADKIAPGKPVRYYAFGHHHPWYIGGVRPFIHRGAQVISRPESLDYLRFIASASHSMQPDTLHLDPQPLRVEMIDTMLTISDGAYEMKVIHIGMRSAHTEDYLIFYFPQEKMVVHGDLVWMKREGPQSPASVRERGLYDAIREFGLEVETILQIWPVSEAYGVRSIYPMSALQKKIDIVE